ncbi:helix-turn-helix domain-containing protein [Methylobacterium nonmethylotrophicum]|uniref:Transcriptional regulator n=1 Tax=Methylobacterium nonmethylotrophicum TaxID=1141884 RepID=A0A4Z0NGQ3_9HYPH|nr:transcriptional regulator [Methylobacterium nonmethylotrophicum]TGD94736.1 transcriptional regulator [Methylobacterium nonmethylotrophicum]
MTDSFTRIMSGAKSALATMEGNPPTGTVVHAPDDLDVAEIRTRTGLEQSTFTETIGVSFHTLRNWGQRRRRPEGPARVVLALVEKRPQVVPEILGMCA